MSNKIINILRKRYILIPILLLIYLGIMAWIGRDRLLIEKDYLGYFSIIGAELIVIIGVIIFLRKKAQIKEKREKINKKED